MNTRAEKLFRALGDIDPSILDEVDGDGAPWRARNTKRTGVRLRRMALAVAATFAVLLIIPNISPAVAYAAYQLPVLGAFFEVVTFRNYDEHNGNVTLSGNVPHVTGSAGDATDETNVEIDQYISTLVGEFRATHTELGSLDFDYTVVTDNDRWFTLEIYSTEVGAGGYNRAAFYHIDKSTGETVTLSKLLSGSGDYVKAISDYIRGQMELAMESDTGEMYFIGEDGFTKIDPEQGFYFNAQGELVIVFNEYDVAPGSMGMVEFTIPESVVSYESF